LEIKAKDEEIICLREDKEKLSRDIKQLHKMVDDHSSDKQHIETELQALQKEVILDSLILNASNCVLSEACCIGGEKRRSYHGHGTSGIALLYREQTTSTVNKKP
jgi:hypothetical protein